MKTFKNIILDEDESATASNNVVGDGKQVAGLTDEPIKKKGLLFLTMRRNSKKKINNK